MWACCNRDCTGVATPSSREGPNRRQALRHPHLRLRLHADPGCWSCSTASSAATSASAASWWTADPSVERRRRASARPTVDVVATEGPPVFRRLHTDYVWFWPGSQPIAAGPELDHRRTPEPSRSLGFAFAPATWTVSTGRWVGVRTASRLDQARVDRTATAGCCDARRLPDDSPLKIPALPDRCPRCDTEDWNHADKFFAGSVRSPIRAHTSGAAQSTQLYLSQLVRSMGDAPPDSRTIVFTDSRDDAARTAAGVAMNHYRDVVRQLTQQVLERGDRPDIRSVGREGDVLPALGRPSRRSSTSSSAVTPKRSSCFRRHSTSALDGRGGRDRRAGSRRERRGCAQSAGSTLRQALAERLVALGCRRRGQGRRLRRTRTAAPGGPLRAPADGLWTPLPADARARPRCSASDWSRPLARGALRPRRPRPRVGGHRLLRASRGLATQGPLGRRDRGTRGARLRACGSSGSVDAGSAETRTRKNATRGRCGTTSRPWPAAHAIDADL